MTLQLDVPKFVAISGLSNGIGKESARLLKHQGTTIIGLDITAPTEFFDHYIAVDLTDKSSIETAASELRSIVSDSDHSGLDGLCHIAGLPPRESEDGKTSNASDVLMANFLGLRYFHQSIKGSLANGASVVNMASRAGAQWLQNMEQVKALMSLTMETDMGEFCREQEIDATRAYNLSKEAVIVWTKSMTESLLPMNQRMNTVSPSAVATDILDDFYKAFGPKVAINVKRIGRAGSPEEIAQAVVWLLSANSQWMRGEDLTADGGMSAVILSDSLDLHSS